MCHKAIRHRRRRDGTLITYSQHVMNCFNDLFDDMLFNDTSTPDPVLDNIHDLLGSSSSFENILTFSLDLDESCQVDPTSQNLLLLSSFDNNYCDSVYTETPSSSPSSEEGIKVRRCTISVA